MASVIKGTPTNGAGEAVVLDGTGKLPAVDGSALTNLPIPANAYIGGKGQAFTTAGSGQTFTIPTGVTALKVTVVGGGGGGGIFCTQNVSSSAGGNAVKWLTGLTPGNTLSVTVAAGGAGSSTGAGGTGGTSSVASGTQTISTISATGGACSGSMINGGVGSGGDLNGRGSAGGGISLPSGSSILSGGVFTATGTAGVYGAGSTGNVAGGAGAVIFEW